jgi:hypothetical protein
MVAEAYAQLASSGGLYRFGMTAEGYPVVTAGATQTGVPHVFVAFREDVTFSIVAGHLGHQLGNQSVAQIMGHEATHLYGLPDPDAYNVPWGYKP